MTRICLYHLLCLSMCYKNSIYVRTLLNYLFVLVPNGPKGRNDESRKPPTFFEDAIVLTGRFV